MPEQANGTVRGASQVFCVYTVPSAGELIAAVGGVIATPIWARTGTVRASIAVEPAIIANKQERGVKRRGIEITVSASEQEAGLA